MNFQEFVDCVKMPCAILSVENKGNGRWGEIRIVCSNEIYKKTMGPSYHDGMLYQELVAKDLKFEDYCYRAAILHQRMHAYVETVEDLGFWTDQQMIPLESKEEQIGYCQFTFEFTKSAEADRMVPVSADVASMVVKCCIKLLGGGDFRESVEGVVSYILEASEGFNCRIMLVDEQKQEAVNFC
jgi:hypothetical protein